MLRKIVIFLSAITIAVTMTACASGDGHQSITSDDGDRAGTKQDPYRADVIYVRLNDGRVLECLRSSNNKGSLYDCNWDNPVVK